MNSEMMAKLRGLIEEAATGECNMTAEGTACPVHENEQCPGYIEEVAPAGISDELAAKKIAAKLQGTPNLNIPKIKQYVTKYLGMVGKAPTDVDHLAALVHTELGNKGLNEAFDINATLGQVRKAAKQAELSHDEQAQMQFAREIDTALDELFQYYDSKQERNNKEKIRGLIKRNKAAQQKADSMNANNVAEVLLGIMRSTGMVGESAKNKKPDADGDGVPDWADKKPGKDDKAGKKPKAKGEMSAKQAKYFGKKKAVKESREFSPELLALMQKYGVADDATDASVDEDMHITVDGAEAQEMINRLMSLAGQDGGMPAMDDHAAVPAMSAMPAMDDHDDMCDGCGHASGECTCDHMTPASFGPDGLSMEENIDHDYGHTAHSDMGEPVDPDTYTYKAPVGTQRFVKGTMGDNPLIKENASALGAKLKKDYKRYVAEAELARSNAGDLSPLSKDNREKFDIDPFVGEEPVTDGSRSPLSTVKRQKLNK